MRPAFSERRADIQPFYTVLNPNVTADRTLPLFTTAPSQATLDSLTLTLNDVQTPTGFAGSGWLYQSDPDR